MTPTPIELLAQAKAEWGWSPEELPALLAPALTGKQSISMLCAEMTLWTDIEDDHDSLPGTATLTGPAADYGLLADYALVALKITHTALAESLERERGLRRLVGTLIGPDIDTGNNPEDTHYCRHCAEYWTDPPDGLHGRAERHESHCPVPAARKALEQP